MINQENQIDEQLSSQQQKAYGLEEVQLEAITGAGCYDCLLTGIKSIFKKPSTVRPIHSPNSVASNDTTYGGAGHYNSPPASP